MRSIEFADYLVMIGDGATVLCKRHAEALAAAYAAADQPLDVYPVQEDDENGMPMDPITCQACHMAAVKESTLQ
jgi:hypothetical protein